jgi:hypothetical protein
MTVEEVVEISVAGVVAAVLEASAAVGFEA